MGSVDVFSPLAHIEDGVYRAGVARSGGVWGLEEERVSNKQNSPSRLIV